MPELNQCDGCNLGLPIDEHGFHYHPEIMGWGRLHMYCCQAKYEVSKEDRDKAKEWSYYFRSDPQGLAKAMGLKLGTEILAEVLIACAEGKRCPLASGRN